MYISTPFQKIRKNCMLILAKKKLVELERGFFSFVSA